MLLFHNFQHRFTGGGRVSTSTSSSGKNYRRRFSTGELDAELVINEDRFELTIRELNAPKRMLFVSNGDKKELNVRLLGDSVTILQQTADGSVRWVEVGTDTAKVYSAPSFAELYANHPGAIESVLFVHLQHAGLLMPMKRYDPAIVQRLLSHITAIDKQERERFVELMEQIDGNSFAVRDAASKELLANVSKYSNLILQADQENALSAEARHRLAGVLKMYREQFHQVDQLISAAGWTQDPAYLIDLLHQLPADQANIVVDHLREITKQDFANDTTAWSTWLRDSQTDD
ncbi:hypothetical protein [Stieleria varia]|uniref:Uncharacterized protein n=1 Tax=Stieleria varia TaxID=2528005 RepID=A0A5C6B832_9BACT|nr:hypothetical protein [Stieleria varia]TWU08118.1 hypothetical protein Pla52n_07000 [Stieleria varia]